MNGFVLTVLCLDFCDFVCLNQAAVKRVPLMGRRGAVYCLDIGSWGHLVSVHLP